ncbi:hypothetical protein J1N35_007878, partial [Gossypium stocksii]
MAVNRSEEHKQIQSSLLPQKGRESTLRKASLRSLGHQKLKGREPESLNTYLSLNASSV